VGGQGCPREPRRFVKLDYGTETETGIDVNGTAGIPSRPSFSTCSDPREAVPDEDQRPSGTGTCHSARVPGRFASRGRSFAPPIFTPAVSLFCLLPWRKAASTRTPSWECHTRVTAESLLARNVRPVVGPRASTAVADGRAPPIEVRPNHHLKTGQEVNDEKDLDFWLCPQP